MSVATLRPAAVIFREDQNFAWWVYGLLAVLFLSNGFLLSPETGQGPPPPRWVLPLSLAMGAGAPLLLVVFLLRMTTLILPGECLVWFGWVPTYRRGVPLASIEKIEVVEYRPLIDCGGWGIRRGRNGERVLNARGNRGVRLGLVEGGSLLIGSQRPEELADAIDQARRALA